MNAPRTSVEDTLARVLSGRAAEVTSAPDYLAAIAVEPEPRPAWGASGVIAARPLGAYRFPGRGKFGSSWLPAVMAALLIAAVGLGVALAPDRNPPAPTVAADVLSPRCVAVPDTSLTRAIQDGRLTDRGQPLTALSLYADGSVLAATGDSARTTTVVLLDPGGAIATIWSAPAGQDVRAVANPTGAIEDDLAVFELVPFAAGQVPAKLVVYDRHLYATTVKAFPRGWTGLAEPETGPTTANDVVTVLMRSTTSSAEQMAEYEVALAGSGAATPQVALLYRESRSDAFVLLSAGGNQISLSRSGGGVRLDHAATDPGPTKLPNSLATAVRAGVFFATDRTNLRWLQDTATHQYLWEWTAGDARPARWQIRLPSRVASVLGPLLQTDDGLVLDTRSRRAARLSAGTSVVQVAGEFAIVARTTGGQAITALVPLSSILPSHC